ncbi:uncharacterized protein LOC123530892 [Mercenaria mercenaria]|uniref:uncharacterized protein LOC123530892 n=1 Tax=Mercenaria mercenaria TaxID=6596 RepID=UPI00234E8954|nr:uncharacterized protein LOC123530892 [Mercenaria mercenaria]
MGVDIDTYRGRIGTFKHSCGQDVVTIVCVINFSRGLKYVGAVLFIGILLLIAGIEANPGPGKLLSYLFFVAIVVVGLGLLLQGAESKELTFFALCILAAIGLFFYAYAEHPSRSNKIKAEENREGDETPKQTSRTTDSILQRDAAIPLRVGSQEPDVTVQLHEDHGPEILQQTVSSLNVQESDTSVPQASSMLKKAEENREDKCIDDSLQLPTLDSDKSSRALPRSRPLGEPSGTFFSIFLSHI